ETVKYTAACARALYTAVEAPVSALTAERICVWTAPGILPYIKTLLTQSTSACGVAARLVKYDQSMTAPLPRLPYTMALTMLERATAAEGDCNWNSGPSSVAPGVNSV